MAVASAPTGNMEPKRPARGVFQNQLVKLEVLPDVVDIFLPLTAGIKADVGSFATKVLTVLDASDGGVESRRAKARVDDDGMPHVIAERLQQLLAEVTQCGDVLLLRCVVDAESARRGRGGKFVE